jgi:hypothetical protein
VRRLVSEGSRPRLPWGQRLQLLVRNPAPTLPLLRALQDDPSAYVRRSVANHLNDIAKDHPELVAQWVHDHRLGASAQRSALLRHASRTLIKQGHGPTLAAWGLGQPLRGQAELALSASRVAIGDTLGLHVTLRSASAHPQTLVMDYVVHHVRANGSASPQGVQGLEPDAGRSGNTGARQAPQSAPGDHAHAVPRHPPHRTAHQRKEGGRRGF